MEIQKISDLKPASFSMSGRNDSLQVKLIVELINDSIKNEKPITLDNIRNAHAEYSMNAKRNGTGYGWHTNADGKKQWRRSISKDEWLNCHCCPSLSITWFKNNLGAAIMKGRLLAIPVIDIDE